MKQVLIRRGQAVLEEVPAPGVEPGTLLVQVEYSCISAGTELSGMRASGMPLWQRALTQPHNVRKAMQWVATRGVAQAAAGVAERLGAAQPTGYSAAGRAVAVAADVQGFQVGDRVACAGAQCAFHAEFIRVPANLAVVVDEGIGLDHASTVTLGAIALQGIRRAAPTLGETFVVIGLGILGQLSAQLLKANGCRVVGADTDPARVRLALELGMDHGLSADQDQDIAQVRRITGGVGADGVIVTAASSSDAVMASAFGMCRKKGRVVLVGDVGLQLNRSDFYEKELDFLISSSYGPGRYDARYEEQGLDYPVGYVRWTENRNMGEYLRLLAEGRVRLAPLLSATWPVERATDAYASLQDPVARPMMVLLAYPKDPGHGAAARSIANPLVPSRPVEGRIRLALVGAGSFARGMHLPHIKAMPDRYLLQTVVSRSGHNAQAAARQFDAANASTDYAACLLDPAVDAVLIATRHHLHADMVLAALAAGKHVLVEKPMAITPDQLARISAFYRSDASVQPMLMTGFNRRFSPCTRRMLEIVSARSNPMILNYRMNAGHLDAQHWVHGPEGGGRNIGEACHIYDLFTCLTASRLVSVTARSIRPATAHYMASDNFVATLSFADGSLATLTYTALGSPDHPKEQLEVFVDGLVLTLDDYKSLRVHGSKARGITSTRPEKGQKEELEAFAEGLQRGHWPIEFWQQEQACAIAFEVERQLAGPAAMAGETR